jgi:tRNA A37 threonylcarbamoyltransferase TsaD
MLTLAFETSCDKASVVAVGEDLKGFADAYLKRRVISDNEKRRRLQRSFG